MRRAVLNLVLLLAVSLCLSAAAEKIAYISQGDSGFVVRLLQAYLLVTGEESEASLFGEDTLEVLTAFQAENGLEESGVFDDTTLRVLLGLEEEADDSSEQMVWVPMNGGRCYHQKRTCCDMIEPRQMSVRCAECLSFSPCGICAK